MIDWDALARSGQGALGGLLQTIDERTKQLRPTTPDETLQFPDLTQLPGQVGEAIGAMFAPPRATEQQAEALKSGQVGDYVQPDLRTGAAEVGHWFKSDMDEIQTQKDAGDWTGAFKTATRTMLGLANVPAMADSQIMRNALGMLATNLYGDRDPDIKKVAETQGPDAAWDAFYTKNYDPELGRFKDAWFGQVAQLPVVKGFVEGSLIGLPAAAATAPLKAVSTGGRALAAGSRGARAAAGAARALEGIGVSGEAVGRAAKAAQVLDVATSGPVFGPLQAADYAGKGATAAASTAGAVLGASLAQGEGEDDHSIEGALIGAALPLGIRGARQLAANPRGRERGELTLNPGADDMALYGVNQTARSRPIAQQAREDALAGRPPASETWTYDENGGRGSALAKVYRAAYDYAGRSPGREAPSVAPLDEGATLAGSPDASQQPVPSADRIGDLPADQGVPAAREAAELPNAGESGQVGRLDQPPGARDDGGRGSEYPDRRADPGSLGLSDQGRRSHLDPGEDYRFSPQEEAWQEAAPARERFKTNVDAVRIARELADTGRTATPAERETLAKFSGFGDGAYNSAFPQYRGKPDPEMLRQGADLKRLLSPEEWQSMARSRLNANFTTPTVIRAMWDGLKRLGLDNLPTIKVLEPSAGTGRFLGLMPESVARKASVSAVEMDRTTGAILKALYPKADVHVAPFEKADVDPKMKGRIPDDGYDLVISNVPFGNYGVVDGEMEKRAGKQATGAIHNYFFAKGLDKVRPGGVVAYITSSYTMNAPGAKGVRQYLADRAELLGAIRLPRGAFPDTAVVTDILFMRKRPEPIKGATDSWINADLRDLPAERGYEAKAQPVGRSAYYDEHPENVLGTEVFGRQAGAVPGYAVVPGLDWEARLSQAIEHLPANALQSGEVKSAETAAANLPSEGSWVTTGGKLQQVRDGKLVAPAGIAGKGDGPKRITSMLEIHDLGRKVLDLQRAGADDAAIAKAQGNLNRAYDAFVQKWKPLNVQYNRSLLGQDGRAYWLRSLERWNDALEKRFAKNEGKVTAEDLKALKADIFDRGKRVQEPERVITSAETPKDALLVSLGQSGRLDVPAAAQLLGKSTEETSRLLQDEGLIFSDPAQGTLVTADEYLSGNVKQKLAEARAAGLTENVKALVAVQPQPLTARDIDVRMGAYWLPEKDVNQFINDLVGRVPTEYFRYLPSLGRWAVTGTPQHQMDWSKRADWQTDRMDALDLIEHALNNKAPKIMDRVSTDPVRYALNEEATRAAQAKIMALKAKFNDWLWSDAERATRLVQDYNDRFNTDRPRTYDGSHLAFPGKTPDSVREPYGHQKDAAWRMVQSPSTLLAHEVGFGKTDAMILAGMEMKRLGVAKKPMYVVPNKLIGQFAGMFHLLYPSANLLVATSKDFEAGNRATLMAKVTTGDWDGVIVGHSQFKLIPTKPETQIEFYERERAQIEQALDTLAAGRSRSDVGRDPTMKELEKTKARLVAKIEKAVEKVRDYQSGRKETTHFEDLGVDQLFVDEFHNFKNLQFVTTRDRIRGLPNSHSDRALDMYLKTQHLLEKQGRGVVGATGTPISNTIAELWTMMRYLDPDQLRMLGMDTFDAWASNYGEVVSKMEQKITGQWQVLDRFAKFSNVPELSKMWQRTADIRTSSELRDQAQRKPKLIGGKREVIKIPTNPWYKALEQSLAERSKNLKGQRVQKGGDNMFKITDTARKASLDPQLVGGPPDPNGKITQAVRRIKEIYDETNDQKGTQVVFLDMGIPKSTDGLNKKDMPEELQQALEAYRKRWTSEGLDMEADDEADFIANWYAQQGTESPEEVALMKQVYERLKNQLEAAGIPRNDVAFIHDAKTDLQVQSLFQLVNAGEIRVLIGNTAKLGEGANVNRRLAALHHLDTPWKPSEVEQREGRILRQGNQVFGPKFKDGKLVDRGTGVRVIQYLTEWPFDAYAWNTILSKARAIKSIMKRDVTDRSLLDADDFVLSAEEMTALASGDPWAMRKMLIEEDARQIRAEMGDYITRRSRALGTAQSAPKSIAKTERDIAALEGDLTRAEQVEGFQLVLDGKGYTEPKDAGQPLVDELKRVLETSTEAETVDIGTFNGFPVVAQSFGPRGVGLGIQLTPRIIWTDTLKGTAEMAAAGLPVRLQNLLQRRLPEALEKERGSLRYEQQRLQVANQVLTQKFEKAEQLEKLEEGVRLIERRMMGEKREDGSPAVTDEDIEALVGKPGEGAVRIREEDPLLDEQEFSDVQESAHLSEQTQMAEAIGAPVQVENAAALETIDAGANPALSSVVEGATEATGKAPAAVVEEATAHAVAEGRTVPEAQDVARVVAGSKAPPVAPSSEYPPAVPIVPNRRPDGGVEYVAMPKASAVAETDNRIAAIRKGGTPQVPAMDGMAPLGLKAPEEPRTFKFDSTQLDLPPQVADHVYAESQQRIHPMDLAGDGVEQEPHITVVYGTRATEEQLRTALKDVAPIEVELGETRAFPEKDGARPIYASVVKNEALDDLNARLQKLGLAKGAKRYPEYQPHVTMAYVKPEMAVKYEGQPWLSGTTFTLDHLTFSTKDGRRVQIPLSGETFVPAAPTEVREVTPGPAASVDPAAATVPPPASGAVAADGQTTPPTAPPPPTPPAPPMGEPPSVPPGDVDPRELFHIIPTGYHYLTPEIAADVTQVLRDSPPWESVPWEETRAWAQNNLGESAEALAAKWGATDMTEVGKAVTAIKMTMEAYAEHIRDLQRKANLGLIDTESFQAESADYALRLGKLGSAARNMGSGLGYALNSLQVSTQLKNARNASIQQDLISKDLDEYTDKLKPILNRILQGGKLTDEDDKLLQRLQEVLKALEDKPASTPDIRLLDDVLNGRGEQFVVQGSARPVGENRERQKRLKEKTGETGPLLEDADVARVLKEDHHELSKKIIDLDVQMVLAQDPIRLRDLKSEKDVLLDELRQERMQKAAEREANRKEQPPMAGDKAREALAKHLETKVDRAIGAEKKRTQKLYDLGYNVVVKGLKDLDVLVERALNWPEKVSQQVAQKRAEILRARMDQAPRDYLDRLIAEHDEIFRTLEEETLKKLRDSLGREKSDVPLDERVRNRAANGIEGELIRRLRKELIGDTDAFERGLVKPLLIDPRKDEAQGVLDSIRRIREATEGGQLREELLHLMTQVEGMSAYHKELMLGYKERFAKAQLQRIYTREDMDHFSDAVRRQIAEIDWTDPRAAGILAKAGTKPDLFRQLQAVRAASLLSGASTQVVNFFGNMLMVAGAPVGRAGAALSEEIVTMGGRRRAKEANWGEVGAEISGMRGAFRDALRDAQTTWQTGVSTRQLRDLRTAYAGEITWPVLGRGPTSLNNVFRLMGSVDDFFRTLNFGGALGAEVERQGIKMRQAGESMDSARTRARAEMLNHPEMIERAAADADRRTFQQRLEGNYEALSRLRANPAVQFLMPFFSTSANIMRIGFDLTPIGFVRAERYRRAGDLVAAANARGEALLGSTSMLVFGLMAAEGSMSGAGPSNDNERRMLLEQGWQPFSLKVGDQWIPYMNLGPVAIPMAFSATLVEAVKEGSLAQDKATAMLTKFIVDFGGVWMQMSAMRGMQDAFNALEDPARYGESFLQGQITSLIPYRAFMAQFARAFDPEVKKPDDLLESILAIIPFASRMVPADVTALGEPRERTASGVLAFSPIRATQSEPNPLYQELDRLDSPLSRPSRYLGDGQLRHTLTGQEYEQYQRSAGQHTKTALETLFTTEQYKRATDDEKRQMVEFWKGYARRAAREDLGLSPLLPEDASPLKYRGVTDKALEREIEESISAYTAWSSDRTGAQIPSERQLELVLAYSDRDQLRPEYLAAQQAQKQEEVATKAQVAAAVRPQQPASGERQASLARAEQVQQQVKRIPRYLVPNSSPDQWDEWDKMVSRWESLPASSKVKEDYRARVEALKMRKNPEILRLELASPDYQRWYGIGKQLDEQTWQQLQRLPRYATPDGKPLGTAKDWAAWDAWLSAWNRLPTKNPQRIAAAATAKRMRRSINPAYKRLVPEHEFNQLFGNDDEPAVAA